MEKSASRSQALVLCPVCYSNWPIRPFFWWILCILSFIPLFSITAPSFAASDGWTATYGGVNTETAKTIHQTDDEGYIVAGWARSFSAGDADLWVLKLAPDGIVVWQKSYGGDGYDSANSILQTSDGGYIAAGQTSSFGAGDADLWVLKLRPDGTIEWQKTYGGVGYDSANSIQQTSDGGYIVAGLTSYLDAVYLDTWVLRLEPDGRVKWQKTYGEGIGYRAKAVQQTSDGGYIVVGETWPLGTEKRDAWVLKLAPDGTLEWQRIYGGDDTDYADSIQQTSAGGYIVAGTTASFGAGDIDFWVLKLKPNGTLEWQKTYGGASYDSANSIQQTSDGGYIVAGQTSSFGAGVGDLWILKLKSDGTVEWQKTYGGGNWDWGHSIQQTSDGGYIATGGTESFSVENGDFWVLKLKPDGSIDPQCHFIMDSNVTGKDSSAAVRTGSANAHNSNVKPRDSSLTILETNVLANVLCP